MHCRMFSNMPGLYPLYAMNIITYNPVITIEKSLQALPNVRGMNSPQPYNMRPTLLSLLPAYIHTHAHVYYMYIYTLTEKLWFCK